MRANGGLSQHWAGLIGQVVRPNKDEETLTEEERKIRQLGRIMSEYFEYRKSNGITKVYHEFAKWLLRKKWYEGPLRQK